MQSGASCGAHWLIGQQGCHRWVTVQSLDGCWEPIGRRSHQMTGIIYTQIQGLIGSLKTSVCFKLMTKCCLTKSKGKAFSSSSEYASERGRLDDQSYGVKARFQPLLEGIHGVV